MMNKENRMEALKNAGVNVDNFFDLSMRIPFGAEVKIVVDGKEMVVGQSVSSDEKRKAVGIPAVNCVPIGTIGGTPVGVVGVVGCSATGKSTLENDPIVQGIIESGYVFNSRTDGRFVTAQTFKMLNERSWNWKLRKYEFGWDAYLRNCY